VKQKYLSGSAPFLLWQTCYYSSHR